GEHDGGGGRGGQAKGQQRDKGAGGGGVVGCFRAGDALDGAVAEFVLVFGQAFFDRIGEECADFGAAGGHSADGEADGGAAQPRLPGAGPVGGVHEQRALDGLD